MSSSPEVSEREESGDLIELHVEADSPLVQVSVVDGSFRRVAGGLGSCKTRQAPGLYKVKFDAGSKADEQFVTLRAGSPPVTVMGPPVAFATAAPLVKTSTTREYHRAPAERESRIVHKKGPVPTSSYIYLFVRDLESEGSDGAATGVSLLDVEGTRIVDLTQDGARGYVKEYEDPWAACNTEVSPGVYRLRSEVSGGRAFEQAVVVSPGWQTQVFLLRKPVMRGRGRRHADLLNASIQMARPDRGFDPQNAHARSGELARQALARERAVMSESAMRDLLPQLLPEKFDNPMLGILGAHLLLIRQEPDLALLEEVITNLRVLLPGHPDVDALALEVNKRIKLPSETPPLFFTEPPMLARSWSVLTAESIERPGIIPAGCFAARVAELLCGGGAWLVWKKPAKQRAGRARSDSFEWGDVSELVTQIRNVVKGYNQREALQTLVGGSRLSPIETHVLSVLSESSMRRQSSLASPQADETMLLASAPTRADLVRELDVPAATVQAALQGLQQKLC